MHLKKYIFLFLEKEDKISAFLAERWSTPPPLATTSVKNEGFFYVLLKGNVHEFFKI